MPVTFVGQNYSFMIMEKERTTACNPIGFMARELLLLYVFIGFVLRIVLMFAAPADASFGAGSVLRLLFVGLFSDTAMGVMLLLPLVLLYLGLNEWKYRRPVGLVISGLLLAALVYVSCFHSIFSEYGGSAARIARYVIGWKFVSFTLRFLLPAVRNVWRRVSVYAVWALYVFFFIFVSVGEFFFWQEFGVRYNFIAVDYLVYTNEVIGNIMESYSMVPIISTAVVVTAALVWWRATRHTLLWQKIYTPRQLALHVCTVVLAALCSWGVLWGVLSLPCDNQYVAQLEQNGACNFCVAFNENKLEYDRFYPLLPQKQAIALYRHEAGLDAQGQKVLGSSAVTARPNIVLITVESLSADFLTRYGNKENITPHLDKLMEKSMVFDSLYAAGNRTVRGLEALSLCIPPSAGESIIKRRENRMGQLSVGSVLAGIGYRCQFLYGGDSYFDNMGDFFSHNGYEVIDRKQIDSHKITFSNIWGVCDEDMFTKALEVFDADARSPKPFFAQIMTTSNHRPFTYPAGRIQVKGDPNTREAAVKYTDYAIGRFIDEAARKPWFANTVFVIIADHCASSAGRTSLPVDRYHIPCIVYAPGLVRPAFINKVCSQIDVMPTVLSQFVKPTKARFAGSDILSPRYRQRAFMATYQDLGYYENGRLTVLSPVRRVTQFRVVPDAGGHREEPVSKPDSRQVRSAEAYYQYVNLYLRAK